MPIPFTNPNPPFRFRRASHVVLTSKDLQKCKDFYHEALGLVVSAESRDVLYLRGLEERSHHSLTIKLTTDTPVCERVGLRVFDEDELDHAKHAFDMLDLPTQWVEVPYQGRTLHTVDRLGTPLEIVASMSREERQDNRVLLRKGAGALRFDHYQVTVSDIQEAAEFYTSLGFRIADFLTAGDHAIGVFLQAKDSPFDVVFIERGGPAFHHCAYIVPDIQSMMRACDTLGELGWGQSVEYGPGKHGVGHSYYVYLRDPDGHRVELLMPPMIYMDGEDEPNVWDVTKVAQVTEAWGLPPRQTWFDERTPFANCAVSNPPEGPGPMTLEKYLLIRN